MVRTGVVIHRILNKLEAGKPDGVIGQVVRSAGIANRGGAGTQILEWDKPGVEDRSHHIVALEVNAPDLARSVVVVEVARELSMLRGKLHGFPVTKMLFHVGARTEQALFFASPESDSYGAVHGLVDGFKHTDCFHHDSASGCVVCSSRAAMPGIKMCPKHHQLILVRSGARDFSDDIEGIHAAGR